MLYAAEREVHDFSEPQGYRKTRKYDKETHPRALRVVKCTNGECEVRFKKRWLAHSVCDNCADHFNRLMGDATP